jgi:hypothetical protein
VAKQESEARFAKIDDKGVVRIVLLQYGQEGTATIPTIEDRRKSGWYIVEADSLPHAVANAIRKQLPDDYRRIYGESDGDESGAPKRGPGRPPKVALGVAE